ncbi:MAG: membrane bound O-acyl transferase family-domain-containing protein [Candidatus Acidiferrales bacterium]
MKIAIDSEMEAGTTPESSYPAKLRSWPGWILLVVLPAVAILFRSRVVAWVFMWTLAIAIFFGCKWQSWWDARSAMGNASFGRTLGYLFAWPGMDAESFLDPRRRAQRPKVSAWISASMKTVAGGVVLWGVARRVPEGHELLAGWVGMLGVILVLHFGTFHLLALAWQSAGIDARPIMRSPLSATSLSDFWGRRWNLGFRQLTHRLIFEPARTRAGVVAAILLSFFASGLIHDLVISFPAGGGYGSPTGYFVLQGLGVLFERSALGKRVGFGSGVRGWLFVAIFAGAPAFLLFHPPFVRGVILPFLEAIGAR